MLTNVFPGESIQAAIDGLTGPGPHTVTLQDGRHEIAETILINKDDVTLAAATPGQAVVSGGVEVDGWWHLGNGRWRAIVGWSAPPFRALSIDGEAAPIARGDPWQIIRWEPTLKKLRVPAAVPIGHEVVWQRHWDVDVFKVANVEIGTAPHWGYLLTPAEPDRTILSDYSIHRRKRDGQTYYGQGSGYLDEHNEWLHDGPYLDVFQTDGTAPENAIRPVLTRLLHVEADRVTIDGLTFRHSAWDKPGYSGVQTGAYYDTSHHMSGWGTVPSAVVLEGADNTVIDSVFEQLGTAGLLVTDSSDTTVADSTFRDIAGIGISVGDLNPIQPTQPGIMVTGNTITNVGTYYSGATGILATYISGATISGNTITDVPYSGMALGGGWWDWYNVTLPNNMVTNNTITRAMGWLDDGAGIYFRGNAPGSMISGNTISNLRHSPTSGGHPVAGIYGDNGALNWTISGNTITDVTDGLFEHVNTLPTSNMWTNNTVTGDVPLPFSSTWTFDSATAVWTHNVSQESFTFGLPGDTGVAGDWNGDGEDEVGIWRDGLFFLDVNGNRVADAADLSFVFGLPTDVPTSGDWDSDGIDEIGVNRDGEFLLNRELDTHWTLGMDIWIFGEI